MATIYDSLGLRKIEGASTVNLNVSAGTTSNNLSAITFSNSNGVSFGLNGSTVTGSVLAQSNQAGTVYALASFGTSSGTYDARTLSISGSGAISVAASNSGFVISAPVQSNQTLSWAMSSNTTGNTSGMSVDARSLTVQGFGLASVGLSTSAGGSSILVSAIPAFSAGGGSSTFKTLSFSNANGVSFSNNAGQVQGSISAAMGIGVSNTGTTAGNTGLAITKDIVFAGSGNITASQSTGAAINTIWFSVPAQSNQSAIKAFGASNTGNTAGNTGVSTGVDWVLAGTNNITVSESTAGGGPNTLWISGAAGGGGAAISAAGASASNGTVVWSNSNNVSFGMNGSTITATATQSAIEGLGVSNTGNTAGNTGLAITKDIVLAASGAITASQSTGANSNTIWFSVAAQSNQSAIKGLGVSNTGNTLGNTGVSTGIDWVLAGTNNVTVSQSTAGGGPNTIWISGAAGGGGAAISAAGNSVNAGTVVWSNSNNVSFGMAGSTITATVTVSQSNQQMTLYATSNTTQSSSGTINASSMLFAGAGIASVGVTNGSVVVSVPSGGGAGDGGVFAGVSTGGNTSGSTGTVSTGNFVLVGTNGITLSQSTGAAGSAATVTISGAGATLSTYTPVGYAYQGASTGLISVAAATSSPVSLFPFEVHQYLSAGVLNLLASCSFTTVGTSSGRQTAGLAVGIYTRNVSTLSSIASTSFAWNVTGNNSTYSISQVTQTNYTGYGAMAQTSSAGSNITSGYTGMKVIGIPVNTLLTPGQYWLAVLGTNSTSSINVGMTMSLIGGVIASKLTGAAPIGSFLTAYSTGQDPAGIYDLGAQGSWTSAGSVTMIPASMAFNSISFNGNNTIAPFFRFWST